jgi:MFS family permease
VFPLKFMLGALVDRLLGHRMVRLPNGTLERALRPEHMPAMMTIYGLGFAAVFVLFALLHAHAWRLRDELDLNELERLDTRQAIQVFAFGAALGLVVVANTAVTALVEGKPYEKKADLASAVVLFACMAALLRFRIWRSRQRRQLVERIKAEARETEG